MGIPIIGDIIDTVGDLISEVVVDKDKKNEIQLKLAELESTAEQRIHEEVLAQIDVNKVEASSGSLFVAGWRPFVGWVSGVGVAYAAVVQPLLSWLARVAGYTGNFPEVDATLLLTVISGMLGIGGMRTFEKVRGVSTNDYRDVPQAQKSAAPVSTPTSSPAGKGRRFKL